MVDPSSKPFRLDGAWLDRRFSVGGIELGKENRNVVGYTFALYRRAPVRDERGMAGLTRAG